MIKEYIVVSDENLRQFQSSVVSKIHDGYKVSGGVCVTKTPVSHGMGASHGSIEYFQAMVLNPIENKK